MWIHFRMWIQQSKNVNAFILKTVLYIFKNSTFLTHLKPTISSYTPFSYTFLLFSGGVERG